MGNLIQYHNTNNPSQMGGICHNSREGFVTTTYCCENPPRVFHNGKAIVVHPPRAYQNRGG